MEDAKIPVSTDVGRKVMTWRHQTTQQAKKLTNKTKEVKFDQIYLKEDLFLTFLPFLLFLLSSFFF